MLDARHCIMRILLSSVQARQERDFAETKDGMTGLESYIIQ